MVRARRNPPVPGSKAVAAPGGFRVTGRWNFASGSRHATWLGAHVPLFEADGSPRMGPNGRQMQRTMLLPATEATMHDIAAILDEAAQRIERVRDAKGKAD